jgi:hypothetical protein
MSGRGSIGQVSGHCEGSVLAAAAGDARLDDPTVGLDPTPHEKSDFGVRSLVTVPPLPNVVSSFPSGSYRATVMAALSHLEPEND